MVAGMIQPPEPCALFGLVDQSLPGEAVGGEVEIIVTPKAPAAPEQEK